MVCAVDQLSVGVRGMYNYSMPTPELYKSEQLTLATALSQLERSLDRLAIALGHQGYWIRVQDELKETVARRRAIDAYRLIDYGADDSAGSTFVCLGVLAVPADLLRMARAVNDAKAVLRAVCTPLQNKRLRVPKRIGGEVETIPLARYLLRRIQRSDLNLLAAYRKIPILDAVPRLVTFTRASTRAVYRKPVAEIARMLEAFSGLRAADDLERLLTLDRDVTHLALVKDHYDNIRANVAYQGLDARGRGRVQISAEIPIISPLKRGAEPPQVRFLQDEDASRSPRRRTSKLEPKPFLQCLPVFRYLE